MVKRRLKNTAQLGLNYYFRDAQGNVLSIYRKSVILQRNETYFFCEEQTLYGSSRLGVAKPEREMTGFFWASASYTLVAGARSYELSNHLGNVLAVISDRGELQSAQDYYPFGMAMPGRSTDAKHRYGFNGKETDPETGLNDFGARLYDGRLGRWLVVDPLAKKYPSLTPYNFVANMPVVAVDPDGKDIVISVKENNKPLRLYYCNGELYQKITTATGEDDMQLYRGNNEFALTVKIHLNQLKEDDPLLKQRIHDLDHSEYEHTIVEDDENENIASKPTDEDGNSQRSGSITTYNSKSYDTAGDPTDKRHPRCALAHELLSHGWDADKGIMWTGASESKILFEEIIAVSIENVARKAAGYSMRTSYNKEDETGKIIVRPIPYLFLQGPVILPKPAILSPK